MSDNPKEGGKGADQTQGLAEKYLLAKDNELSNEALVSALIFTVAAAGILAPSKLNISGTHTDLYGSLCVISLASCLSSILAATMVRRQLNDMGLAITALKRDPDQELAMITEIMRELRLVFFLSGVGMWSGAVSISLALAVNTAQVLGKTSTLVMGASFGLVFILLMAARWHLETMKKAWRTGNPGTVCCGLLSVGGDPAKGTSAGGALPVLEMMESGEKLGLNKASFTKLRTGPLLESSGPE